MSGQEDMPPPAAAAPFVIESGMRTSQGDESADADTLTIGEKYENDAQATPDPATDPKGADRAIHDAAATLGDPQYHPAGAQNEEDKPNNTA